MRARSQMYVGAGAGGAGGGAVRLVGGVTVLFSMRKVDAIA